MSSDQEDDRDRRDEFHRNHGSWGKWCGDCEEWYVGDWDEHRCTRERAADVGSDNCPMCGEGYDDWMGHLKNDCSVNE